MGIPVVVFYPLNSDAGRASDRERYSALDGLVRVYRFEEIDNVDWRPEAIDASDLKLQILDRFYKLAEQWRLPVAPPLGPIAPFSPRHSAR